MSKQEQKHHHIFNINDFIPKRFGLNYNPPQIILEYLTPSTGKLYHHKMRIHKLKKDKPTADIMKELYDKHNQYLDKKKVNPKQIEKLIEKVKANFIDKRKTNNNNKNVIDEKKDVNAAVVEEKKISVEKKKEKKEDDELTEEEEEYNDFDEDFEEDLNKLDTSTLNKKKIEMDVEFEKNNIKKGDVDFQYDVRKDFNHEEYAAEWDDDSY